MKRRVMIAKALVHERASCFWTNPPQASMSNCAVTCG